MRGGTLITIRPYWHELTKESIDRPLPICSCRWHKLTDFICSIDPPRIHSHTHDHRGIRLKTEVFCELLRCRSCDRFPALGSSFRYVICRKPKPNVRKRWLAYLRRVHSRRSDALRVLEIFFFFFFNMTMFNVWFVTTLYQTCEREFVENVLRS